MRKIKCEDITNVVARLCLEANFSLPQDVIQELEKARQGETSLVGKGIFDEILTNARQSAKTRVPLCKRDCGIPLIFVEIGQDVHLVKGDFNDAVIQGVRKGYEQGCFKRLLCDPLTRKEVDGAPVEVHIKIVAGDKLKITVCPKGGGSENMSHGKMLALSEKKEENMENIVDFAVETIKQRKCPCPPITIGVGVGGSSFGEAVRLAKKALFRQIENSKDLALARIERNALREINELGIGPIARSALNVRAEMLPCHSSCLPVAVIVNCYCARKQEIVI